jgi:GT2 family glycosyltransferase
MDKKFSVIIPTMYKCFDVTVKLLANLHEDAAVSEIILIENVDKSERPSVPHPIGEKVKVIPQGRNIYVNPSWNIGAAAASEEYIALVNDDITVPDNIFSVLKTFNLEDIGVLGACDFLIQEVQHPQRFTTRYIRATSVGDRLWGYGIFMVMNINNYAPIPDDLLIWAGDDYLFHHNKNRGKLNAMGLFPIQTKMSTTSSNPEFDEIKKNDADLYELKYKN